MFSFPGFYIKTGYIKAHCFPTINLKLANGIILSLKINTHVLQTGFRLTDTNPYTPTLFLDLCKFLVFALNINNVCSL